MGIGVMALQGGYERHCGLLRSIGRESRLVRTAQEITACDALILPGGESTAMSWLLRKENLLPALRQHCEAGKPLLATCAGLILLAKGVDDPRVEQMGLLDVQVKRNAYGAQVDSFEGEVSLFDGSTMCGIFIRAPQIKASGAAVRLLAWHKGMPVAVQQGNLIAATFHPELTGNGRFHELLASWVYGDNKEIVQPRACFS